MSFCCVYGCCFFKLFIWGGKREKKAFDHIALMIMIVMCLKRHWASHLKRTESSKLQVNFFLLAITNVTNFLALMIL